MNVTSTATNFDPNLARAGYNGIDETKVVADSRQAEIAPLLFGSNILVSYGISDAEALVARLKNENADTHVQLKLKALSAVANGITTQQLRALSQALALADSVKNLEMTRDGLMRTVDIDESLITELALKTATLEEEIKTARENQELYNKQIEKQKADRAELQDKINKLEADTEHDNADEIAALKEQVQALDKSIAEKTDALNKIPQEINEKTTMIEALTKESNDYKKFVEKDAPEMIETAKQQIAALHAQLAPLIASIGESTLKALAEDILGIDPPNPDSPQDRKELEKNTEENDVLGVIRDRLDALAKSILDEVAEKRVDMV